MPLGVLTLDFQIPYAHSLKEKRSVLQAMKSRLRAHYNVAVAEMDHQDVWQRATLCVASVASSQQVVEQVLQESLAEAERILGYDVDRFNLEFF